MLMSMGFSREDNHHPFNSADILVFLFLFLKKKIKIPVYLQRRHTGLPSLPALSQKVETVQLTTRTTKIRQSQKTMVEK
jgi:hypothetical protein